MNNTVPTELPDVSSLLPTTVQPGTVEMVMLVIPSDRYGAFEEVRHDILISIIANVSSEIPEPNVQLSFSAALEIDSIKTLRANSSAGYVQNPYPVGVARLILLPGISSAEIRGHISSTSLLWRNSLEFPWMLARANFGEIFYRNLVLTPAEANILSVYSSTRPGLTKQTIVLGGYQFIVLDLPRGNSASILYDAGQRSQASMASLFFVLGSVAISPYVSRGLSDSKTIQRLRRVYGRFLHRLDSRKLLSLYVLSIAAMIGLSLLAGPDPRQKVFILGTDKAQQPIEEIVRDIGGMPLAPATARLQEVSSIGALRAIIVADFITPSEDFLNLEVYPALTNVGSIILVSEFANPFHEDVQSRYNLKTQSVKLSDLGPVLKALPTSRGLFGLTFDETTYLRTAVSVALLSFIVPFFGLAYYSSSVIERASVERRLTTAAYAIMLAVGYFTLTEAAYLTSSALMQFPVSLHAVTSGSREVTAVGLLGFGGGSRPRLIVGFLGFLLGALVGQKAASKLTLSAVATVIAAFLGLLLSPGWTGIVFHEFVILFTTGPAFDTSQYSWVSVRSFLDSVGTAFAGRATPTYTISLGILLYYMGAIPLFLFSKAPRITATVLLMFAAFASAQGGIRVGELTPWKVLTDIVPGVTAGLILTAIFAGASVVESRVKTLLARLH